MYQPLISWSKKEFSHLPWRENRSIYRTLVSEIMLQQTTVGTVKNHFERFLKQFPDLQSLAMASEEEVLIAWKGLGYYRRAKNLKKIANYLIDECDGKIPHDLDHLLQIPGIGPYTANALLTIGMNNLERVLARIYGVEVEKGLKLHQALLSLYEKNKILHEGKFSSRDLYEALMDLGRTFCQARKASCDLCTLNKKCLAVKNGNPLNIPYQTIKQKAPSDELELLRCLVIKNKKILAYQKEEGEWLSGQWELPTYIIKSTDTKLTQYPKYKKKIEVSDLPLKKTSITKFNITNYLLELSESEWNKLDWPNKTKWLSEKEWNKLSTASLKMLGLKK